MGALLSFFGMASAAPAALLRFKVLLAAAAVMMIACLSLTVWALWERSGRYQAERDAVIYRTQSQVLADSLERCNVGVAAVQKAGEAAQAGVDQLLAAARKLNSAGASLIVDAREIASRPTPIKPDGKPKDCTDAKAEIAARAKGKP